MVKCYQNQLYHVLGFCLSRFPAPHTAQLTLNQKDSASLKLQSKHHKHMTLFERDDVATVYGRCITCSRDTRSHVLEKAKYEEYDSEVVVGRSDDYANTAWEETTEVTKVRKMKEAVVACHTCWLKRHEEIKQILLKDYQKWEKDPQVYFSKIQMITEICHAYEFPTELNAMRYLISIMKESTKQ